MRLLFITDNSIQGFGGGSLGSKKYYDALSIYCQEFGHELGVISLDGNLKEKLPINVYKNRKIDIIARLIGHSTYLYTVLVGQLDIIVEYKPDIIFLGRTRLGFIAKYIKQRLLNTKIITFVDNIEYDYVDSYFSRRNNFLGKIAKGLEKRVVYNDEKDSIFFSDKLVYLTNRDYLRVKALYNFNDLKPVILPVCLPGKQYLNLSSLNKNIYFIGSLNYDANIEAIENFVNKVWIPNFKDDKTIKLTIAGSNPTIDVRALVKKANNICLVENFQDVKDFVKKKSLMIAPIEKGAGMKVKVADTLSMGLLIAASDEALVGYEEATQEDSLQGIIRANNSLEFKKAIKNYMRLSESDLNTIEVQNMCLFDKYYSFKRSRESIRDIIDSLDL